MHRRSSGSLLITSPFLVLVLLMGFWSAECRPPQSSQDFDPVDLCIFNCDSCFKGEALVKCANECITQDGIVGPIWSHSCRHFLGFSGVANGRLIRA